MTALNQRFDMLQAVAAPMPGVATGLAEHLATHRETCPDCRYDLEGVSACRCPECGLALRASMFVGVGRALENVRLGMAWGLLRLPFMAGAWSLGWAMLIAFTRLSKPMPGATGANPIQRLAAAGELYTVTFQGLMGLAYLGLGVGLWVCRADWQRDRTWRLWLLAACVVAFIHAPSLLAIVQR